MLGFKSEAASLFVLIMGVSWATCDIKPYSDAELVDKTCGESMSMACCPNLKVAFDTPVIEINVSNKGGENTCRCRCTSEDSTTNAANKILKQVEDAGTMHYFCKAGFGQMTTAAPAEGANEGQDGASASGASILQLSILMVVLLMAATTILLISYE